MDRNQYIKDFIKVQTPNTLLCDYKKLPDFYVEHKKDIPPSLYKYLPMNADFYWETLSKKQAWLSFSLRDMNIFTDKNDSALDFDIENMDDFKKLVKSKTPLEDTKEILTALKNSCVEILNQKSTYKTSNVVDMYIYNEAVNKCQSDLEIITNTFLTLNMKNCLDNFKETYRELLKNHMESELRKIGILSLTKSFQNDFMWKNYGDNYSGICVSYKTEKLPIPVFPILYRKTGHASLTELFGTGEITYQALAKRNYIRFLIKEQSQYAKEHEWRGLAAIDKCNDFSSPPLKGFAVDGFKPHKIYIGENMESKNKKRLIEFCSKEHIKFQIYAPKNSNRRTYNERT